jgi:hypothetical protein
MSAWMLAAFLACGRPDTPAGGHGTLVYSGNVDGDIEPCG